MAGVAQNAATAAARKRRERARKRDPGVDAGFVFMVILLMRYYG